MPKPAHVVWTVFVLSAGLLAAAHAAAPRPGLNPADMDLSVSPREDFYRYANGGWLARTRIPADEGEYGVFQELSDRSEKTQLRLLERLARDNTLRRGSDEWKAVALFGQATDLAKRNAQGVAPIAPILRDIDTIGSLADVYTFLARGRYPNMLGFLSLAVMPDLKDSGVYAAYVGAPSLGLPNRDFYLEDDATNRQIRAAYRRNSARMLRFLGYSAPRAARAAERVYRLERRLAEPTLTREQQQNVSLLYNPMPVARVQQLYPLMNWAAYLRGHGLAGVERPIVTEVAYLRALPETLRDTPLETLKDFLRLQTVRGFASTLSASVEQADFDFYGRVLGGQGAQRPLRERALGAVNSLLGDALGKLYVAETFPPEAKTQITGLTDEVLAAFGRRLERLTWMSPATKQRAREKLAAVDVKVGYPDTWKRYGRVKIRGSYAQTYLSAARQEFARRAARFGKPVDRAEWGLPPQVVNAYYNPLGNEIVFPAGILQPPFFDYRADPASNYGAIGFVIGHEITHGFDLQGSQFDAEGNLANWWTPADRRRFDALNKRLAAQYSQLEVLPGLFIDGQITLTENTADLGGVQVAYAALRHHLQEAGGPGEIDGLDQTERFFVAAASVWRTKVRDAYLTTQVKSDPHAPGSVRSTQPLKNADAFYRAFGIRAGDPMFLPPEARIVIW